MEQVRDDLSEATRDLRTEPWASTVSPRLSAALTHIVERVERERRLKELVDHAIDRADAADFQWIPRTLELLDECLTRHQALQQVIAVARDTFLIKQQRQHLTPRSLRAFPHPVNEVLMGALTRPCRDCDAPTRNTTHCSASSTGSSTVPPMTRRATYENAPSTSSPTTSASSRSWARRCSHPAA